VKPIDQQSFTQALRDWIYADESSQNADRLAAFVIEAMRGHFATIFETRKLPGPVRGSNCPGDGVIEYVSLCVCPRGSASVPTQPALPPHRLAGVSSMA
jgi:hypothetical protein